MSVRAARDLRETPRVALQPQDALAAPQLSVVIPLFNEEASVEPLLSELFDALRKIGQSFEVIAVDDGSRDGTFAALVRISRREAALRVIRFRRNFGQTAAMSAGIEASRGEVIVPMDGELQNDPADIRLLLDKLDGQLDNGAEGAEARYDVVSGWRKNRIANWLISAISGVRLHDFGCSIKAYRREVLQGVRLYGEMHRFIPIYASWQGARVTEMVVNHRPRRSGTSNYGLGRSGKVILDLLVVKFLASFTTKPIYLFGGFGLLSLGCSLVTFFWALAYKVLGIKDFVQTPLPLLTVLFGLVGILSLLMGLLAELVTRTYYESQNKRPYLIAEQIQSGPDEHESVDSSDGGR